MVGAMVALRHLFRLSPKGERQELVPEANAEDRNATLDHGLEQSTRPLKRGGWIPRSVGQNNPIRIERFDRVERHAFRADPLC